MLRRLTVKNLAIVEDLTLELSEGLTVITGETGAGKSILVDALTLLAGGRGSSELVREGAEKLLVAAEFDTDSASRAVLEEAGLPVSSTILVRREFSADGRGRAFIEDEPAAVRTLARQNSEQELADRHAAVDLLDAFAGADGPRQATADSARAWGAAREALETLEQSRRDRVARLDTIRFQIREIEEAAPDGREQEEITAERDRLLHADRIRRAGQAALEALSEGEGSAADRLGETVRAFSELASIDPRERAGLEEAEELKRRIADLAALARDGAACVESDPERLTAIETRLEKLARLKRKYGVSPAEALELLARLRAEEDELSNFEDALERRLSRGGPNAFEEEGGRGAPLLDGDPEGAGRPRDGEGEATGGAHSGRGIPAAGRPRDGGPALRAQSRRGRETAREDCFGRRALEAAARDPLRRGG